MVDISSITNSQMKLPKLNVGVVYPPDRELQTKLFNEQEADAKLKQMRNEINTAKKKDTFEKRQKTPKSVLYILGGLLIAVVLHKIKLFSGIKNIFSRSKKH